LTSGIFEESARYIAYRFLVPDHNIENGLTYGAGHGGMESILIVGINVTTIGFILLFNPRLLPIDRLFNIETLPLYMPFIGLYERLMTLIVHIGLSLMVLKSFTAKDLKYFVYSIFLHSGFNFVAVYSLKYGVIFPEIIVTLFAMNIGFWGFYQIKTLEIPMEQKNEHN
jgi:uncharacterized membrane protein YhfC